MKYKDFVICAFWLYSKFTQQFAFRLNHLISFPENYQGTPFSAENIQKPYQYFVKLYQNIGKCQDCIQNIQTKNYSIIITLHI